jgi:PAS domain S-box-containing protein
MIVFANKSLSYKFSIILVTVVSFMLIIFSVIIIMHNVRTTETQLEKRINDASRLSQQSLSSALWQFNYAYVNDFVKSLFLYEDIIYIAVFSGEKLIKKEIRKGASTLNFDISKVSQKFLYRESIIIYDDRPIGKIQIVLSRDRVRKTIYRNTQLLILLLFLIVGAILVTNLFISRILLFNPFKKLENSALEIGQGNLETFIDISGTDEIGHLAKTIYQMIQNIKEITASRDELNNEVTQRLLSEDALRKERDRAQNYLDIVGAIILIIDRNGNISLINKKGCQVLGLAEKDILGRNWFESFIPSSEQDSTRNIFNQIMRKENGLNEYYENKIICHSGESRMIAWHNTTLKDESEGIIGTLSSGEDITDRKLADEKIKISLIENDVLLKEIHHRVKNNMQIIQSFLSLQADTIKETEYKKPLIESNNRIKSMALIHETLYRSKDMINLDVESYFNEITQHLLRIYQKQEVDIDLKINIDSIKMDMDLCIACGLILNELVSNALKYAFESGTIGKLSITLKKAGKKQCVLIVKDNGGGLPTDFNIEESESLGLKIVSILVKGQLKGSINLNNDNGAFFDIKFPLKKA